MKLRETKKQRKKKCTKNDHMTQRFMQFNNMCLCPWSCHDFYYIREKNTIFNTANSNMRQQINTPSNRTKVSLDLLAQASTLSTKSNHTTQRFMQFNNMYLCPWSCCDFYYIRDKNTIFNTTNSNMRQQINTPSNRTKVGLDLLAQAFTLWTTPHKKSHL